MKVSTQGNKKLEALLEEINGDAELQQLWEMANNNAVHRDNHENFSLMLGYPKSRQLLANLYDEPNLTTIVSEVLHAIIAHRWDVQPLSLEAGVLKVADALDMTLGRSRIPFETGKVNIHSVSAQAVEEVKIQKF